MQKLPMHSQDITQDNIERIAALFPHCVKEAKNAQGELVRMVDFDALRQELSNSIVDGPQERYDLSWPGKRSAQLAANAPIAKTLRPCKAESVDFDSTKNLFIEGDNLDALKLLQKSYLGKVKMIYIDPPYNTGNDFIYKDNFRINKQEYLLESEQTDEDGNRLVANTEYNGLFHSDWLSMIYPRLKLSRNLLRDDGVIFISCDDNEMHNLRRMCDEIFGGNNFLGPIVWKKKTNGNNVGHIPPVHDYILCYAKNEKTNPLLGFPLSDEFIKKTYSNPDNDHRGPWTTSDLSANHEGPYFKILNPKTGQSFFPANGRYWVFNETEVKKRIADGRIIFGRTGESGPVQKKFLNERTSLRYKAESWWDKYGMNEDATEEIATLLTNKIFPHPKPSITLKHLCNICTQKDDIIIDFFAGSATTAHAIMQLNADDSASRTFIMIQYPEPLLENKAEHRIAINFCIENKLPATIAEISKERIRRAGAKIQAELKEKQQKEQSSQPSLLDNPNSKNLNSTLDIGFRVLKVDSSNMADVYYTPSDTKQAMLLSLTGNIKTDRTAEDLLFQVLIDWGVEPTLPIREEIILGKKVFFVDENALVVCFETGITNELAKELAKIAPLRVLFRDNGFASDAVKINIEQIFTQLSPHTEVKCL